MRTSAETPDHSLADRLEADILFGRLRPRERLIEDELMERTGATRHAVRAALAEMEARHLVARVPNKGAQVRDFDHGDIEQICEMRDWLHERAARSIRWPADPAWLRQLERLQRAHDRAVDQDDPLKIHRANSAFHAALFGGCGNKYLTQTIGEYAQLSLAYRCHLMIRTELAKNAAREHWAMIDAIRRNDTEGLAMLCVQHTKPARAVYEALQGWSR